MIFQMWRMFFTSLQWLQEGMFELMWDDKQMSYSHFIWMEDLNVSFNFFNIFFVTNFFFSLGLYNFVRMESFCQRCKRIDL